MLYKTNDILLNLVWNITYCVFRLNPTIRETKPTDTAKTKTKEVVVSFTKELSHLKMNKFLNANIDR